ncbi:hypothetical protein GDO78_006729 [Eleutherodactylus coqui]|uniref:Large ribosomal subunit protein bL34m n=1 Tax=Eleutherodactylus coqui TaxID=57060 RepID=A0A8J6KBU0_ELECQ|nr:hypothetical protein GDO78_006729 [Eleutherodactylus coqui]
MRRAYDARSVYGACAAAAEVTGNMAVWGSLGRLIWLRPSVAAACAPHRTLISAFRNSNQTDVPSSGCGILSRTLPTNWSLLSVRTKTRGMEYQPSFTKRRRTHGWIRRISTKGGIEVILRRMLKGRKSLTVDRTEADYNRSRFY